MVDEGKLNQFVSRILDDLGGAFSVPLVRIGDKLRLNEALHERGPMTACELSDAAHIAERYAGEAETASQPEKMPRRQLISVFL